MPSAKDLSKPESKSVPLAVTVKQETLLPPEGPMGAEDRKAEASKPQEKTQDEMEVMDAHGEGTQIEGKKIHLLYSRCICLYSK